MTGGLDFNDHRLIWARLDQVHAKHPDMVLLHGGSPKGAEFIAAKWASHRKVTQIAFRPDWTKHAKAAPFKRNDAMLETLPIGVLHFPGTGIQDNLADKARKLGIPVWKFGKGGAKRRPPPCMIATAVSLSTPSFVDAPNYALRHDPQPLRRGVSRPEGPCGAAQSAARKQKRAPSSKPQHAPRGGCRSEPRFMEMSRKIGLANADVEAL